MLKIFNFSLKLIGLLILLAIVGAVGLVVFFNPNDFKPQITQQVYKLTGRQLTINGIIHWSFFPWVGLSVNDVSLSNALSFGNQPFAKIQQADIRIKLLPLFHKQIEVGKLTLTGLQLHLIKNSKGTGNWADLMQQSSAKNQDPVIIDKSNTSPEKAAFVFAIAGVDVTQSQITWSDQQNNKNYTVDHLKLHSGMVALGKTFPLQVEFDLTNPQKKLTQHWQWQMQLNANPAQQRVTVKQLNASIDNLHFQGDLDAKNISTTPTLSGDLQIPNFDINPMISQLRITGIGEFAIHFLTRGNTSQSLLNNLSGQGNLALRNGVLHGIDVLYWVNAGKALLDKKMPVHLTDTQKTDFGNLTATYIIANGVVHNNDLLLRAPTFLAKGEGSINLVNETINYKLNGQLVNVGTQQPQGFIIPLQITGSFNAIRIQPNVEKLIKSQLKDQIKVKINDVLEKKLGKDLGNQLQQQLNNLFK